MAFHWDEPEASERTLHGERLRTVSALPRTAPGEIRRLVLREGDAERVG